MEAPPPGITQDVDAVPALPVSTLNAQIRVDLTPIFADLEDAVPHSMGDLERRHPLHSNDRVHVAWQFDRDPFSATLHGDTARIATVLHYSARAWYNPPIAPELSASCGTGDDEARPRVLVALAARISLSRDWKLAAHSWVQRVAPLSDTGQDACRITLLRIDVTDQVIEGARHALRSHTHGIDQAIANVDVRSKFAQWWSVLAQPIALTDSVWLVMDPAAVRLGDTRGDGSTLVAMVSLEAQPRIVVGGRPVYPPLPLPPLDSAAVGAGLHILAEGVIPYAAASGLLTRELRDHVIEAAGQRIRIRTLTLSGIGGGRLALAVTFTGSARGRIYFVGTPQLDASGDEVTVPDLDFDVATGRLLVNSLAWIAHDNVLAYLRDHARIPVGDAMDQARRYLAEGLNYRIADDARLSGRVLAVRAMGVHPTRQSLILRAHAWAEAQLLVGRELAGPPPADSTVPH